MTITNYLYNEAKAIWEGYFSHPFIQELGKGTLPKEKFEQYLIQDYVYLREYAKAFAMGMVKSSTMDEIRFFQDAVAGCIEGETAVHIQYLKEFGHDTASLEGAKVEMANISYTSYVNTIALTGGIKEIMAATLPCTWSYGVIAQYVKENFNEYLEDNYYKGWIESYNSPEYQEAIKLWIAFTEDQCKDVTEEEKEKLAEIFIKASLYERGFWDMAYGQTR